MTEEFYLPRDIIFERDQILWLLFYLPLLKEGMWPPNPYVSGYADEPMGKSKRYKRAYFETPVQFAAEIGTRLLKTGREGRILYWQVKAAFNSGGNVSYEDLEEDAQDALNYISGWKRKKMSYVAWKKGRNYYQRVMIRGARS